MASNRFYILFNVILNSAALSHVIRWKKKNHKYSLTVKRLNAAQLKLSSQFEVFINIINNVIISISLIIQINRPLTD